MSDEPDMSTADVLPPAVNLLLGLSWVLLFAGRWILPPFLLAAGVLSPSMVSEFDNHILVPCYLMLLAVSITVLVLRAMRGANAKAALVSPGQSDEAVAPIPPQSDSSHAVDRGPNTSD